MAYDLAFSPIKIGAITVPNRIVRTAHGTGYASPDITDRFIEFHEERAKGGCGLTIIEAASVHASSRLEMSLFSDVIVADYQRLMARIRPYGMRVFQQIWHGGNLYPGYGSLPWGVSTVPSATGLVGVPMNEDQIQELIAAFATATLRAREGGLDGVELHAGHGSLFQQFLSPSTNTRTDRWGGDLDGRSRFIMETLRAMRAAVGKDFVIGMRMSSSQSVGGVSESDNRYVLEQVQKEDLIDYINVSQGDYFRQDTMVGTMHNPTGYELPSATQVLAAATVPRLVAGRFRTVDDVEQVLREGVADLVAMTRPHIADPYLVAKTRSGAPEQVRPCISCNQGCIGGALREGSIGCLVNPTVGFERTLSESLIVKAAEPRKIMVIGGGPAGMEAARVAALRGHVVTLVEASPDLGGLINLARKAPKLHGVGDVSQWLEQEVYRLGVEVRLNSFVDASDIRDENIDMVIVATGADPRMDGLYYDRPGERIAGVDRPHVMSSVDVMLEGPRPGTRSAVVSDMTGHFETAAVCETLLSQGIAVTLVTPLLQPMPYIATTFRDVPTLERMYGYGGFEALSRHRVVEILDDSCIVVANEGTATREIKADIVVLISPNEPRQSLYHDLQGEGLDVHMIGDALTPRDIQSAITDGHRLMRAIA